MNQTILITGSNRGLGLEFTKQYAEAGWQILACCRQPETAEDLKQLQNNFPDTIAIHALDVTDFDSIESLSKQYTGPIDVLLNNAGIYGGNENQFGTVNYDNWQETLKTNTIAPMKLAECFVNHVCESKEKKMVFITSKMGSIEDNSGGKSYIYRSSKAGLNAVVKSLSIDLKEQGISCLLLHPGWVQNRHGRSKCFDHNGRKHYGNAACD